MGICVGSVLLSWRMLPWPLLLLAVQVSPLSCHGDITSAPICFMGLLCYLRSHAYADIISEHILEITSVWGVAQDRTLIHLIAASLCCILESSLSEALIPIANI